MKNIIFLIPILILLTSCEDDFLNRNPLDQIGSNEVFQDESLTEAYLANLQGRLPIGLHGARWGVPGYGHYATMLASITDEARAKSGWVDSNSIILPGAITPSNSGQLGLWSSAYTTIRRANTLVEEMESSPLDEDFKSMIIAKARYIRAFTYFELVKRYGDVPLIKKAQAIDDDLMVSRTPSKDVYQYIYEELFAIASVLNNKSEVKAGVINKQAAIALNARATLYAEEWEKAADLADQIITGPENDGIDLHENYRELFLSRGGNKETIFEIVMQEPHRGYNFDMMNWPVRWTSEWGGQTDPTQQMVDSYEMAETGLSIHENGSGFNPDRPYDGRGERFYASIFYHGSEFSQVQPSYGEPFIDMEWNNGNEGPGDSNQHGSASITGYLVKKFADPSVGFSPTWNDSQTSWKEIRYAEVLLIYAEAENEANGPSLKVYNAINKIRERAGLPNLPEGLSENEMREKIRHERKIELAFENHRWFDLIRWDIASDILDGFEPIGIKITRTENAPSKEEKVQLFNQNLLNFETFPVKGRTQAFPESYKLLPIPQSEMDKNPNLTQNPGY